MGESTLPPLSPLKQAYLALQAAQERIAELESRDNRGESIAIIGLGCRIPGATPGPDGYWELLRTIGSGIVHDGVEARWRRYGVAPAEVPPAARHAALLDEIEQFDPEFFGISPREAAGMDPQQRLLLEVLWEALAHAGIAPDSLYGTKTGVYFGLASNDYAQLQLHADGLSVIDPHFASGIAHSVASGRISYLLGLAGPSMVVDTACSSSLVAVHLACEALRHRECDMVLAGGVNVILSPEASLAFAQAGMLAPDGECKAFGAGADGFVRGEGCGVVVLKRLREAEQAGDRVLAVIRASVVNQDGASSGLTVPNGRAQQALLRSALAQAGVSASEVAYVEAHGTGTALGDPIEAEALGSVYGPVAVSSVKTQIGHLEAAAGMAGLLKAVLALQHEQWPGQRMGAAGPSAQIRWAQLGLRVVAGQENWPRTAGQRRMAGVSAFGFSGTNAHVLVEEAPMRTAPPDTTRPERPVHVLVLSALTEAALNELVRRYQAMPAAESWADVCATSAQGRNAQSWRLAIIAATADDAWAALQAQHVSRGYVRAGAAAETVALQIDPGTPAELADAARRAVPHSRPDAPLRLRLTSSATWTDLAQQLGALYCSGAAIDWAGWDFGYGCQRVVVPGPVFERQRYWVKSRGKTQSLLGTRQRTPLGRAQFERRIDAGPHSWTVEHRIRGRAVWPLAGYLEQMRQAGSEALGPAWQQVEDVEVLAPLVLGDNEERWVEVVVDEPEQGRARVRVASLPIAVSDQPVWEWHASGWLVSSPDVPGGNILPPPRLAAAQSPAVLYDHLAARGVQLTEHFRCVERWWPAGEQRAIGEIMSPEPGPWHLDGCLQIATLAAMAGQHPSPPQELQLPVGVGRYRWFAPLTSPCLSHVTLDRDTETVQLSITDSSGKVLAIVENLRFRAAATQNESKIASWFYELCWQPQPLAPMWPALAEYDSFYQQLETLCGQYAAEALRRPLHVVPEQRRLLARLQEIRTELGTTSEPPVNPATLRQRYPFADAELTLVERCGTRLADVLEGRISGHDLLFGDGSLETMERLYRDSLPAQAFNSVLAETVEKFASAGSCRILEIGAGTGGSTAPILERLAGLPSVEYLFTDISPLLVNRARTRFANAHPGLRFQTLNIEQDPLPTTELRGPFDLVIAANVLHATADLRRTLAHVRRLLSPTGRLLLLEVTGKQRWADLTVGLTDGWWNVGDPELRGGNYPALAPGQWPVLLREAGFGEVTTLVPPDSATRQEFLIAGPARRWHVRHAPPTGIPDLPPSVALDEATGVLYFAPETETLSEFLDLVRTLSRLTGPAPRLYVIATPEVRHAALLGLAATAAAEYPSLRCTRVVVDRLDSADVLTEVLADHPADWVSYDHGRRAVARLEAAPPALATPPAHDRHLPGPKQVEIEVHAAGLNFRDVLQANGLIPDLGPLGTECAGTISRVGADVRDWKPGDEVIAIAPDCFRPYVLADAGLTWRKPPQLSFAEAAGQAIAYLTADWALNEIGRLQPGESVLIHAAAGGVGLAAVHLCQRAGARIFATAGNEEKRAYLRSLGLTDVFDSRSPEFAQRVGAVDIVLNSVTGPLLDASLALLAPGRGRFLELGKTDIRPGAVPGYHAIDLTIPLRDQPQVIHRRVQALLDAGLPVLPHRTFPLAERADAFRYMAAARHIGKVILTMPGPLPVSADGTYLITGGLSGLGLAVAHWLAEQGAGHLVLVGRHGTPSADTVLPTKAKVTVVQADIGNEADAARAVAAAGPQLRGVVHCAGVLDDAPIATLTQAQIETVLHPKARGAWHLHTLTQHTPLDFFVLFSSWASLAGAPSQANHCAANTFLDALAHYRRGQGQPAVSINWGAWSEIGAAADAAILNRLGERGARSMSPPDALTALGYVLRGLAPAAQVAISPIDWPRFLAAYGERHRWPSIYANFAPLSKTSTLTPKVPAVGVAATADLVHQVQAALPARRLPLLLDAIQAMAAQALEFSSPDALDPDVPLQEYGLDSLLAVDLRNRLAAALPGQSFPTTLLFDYPTVRALAGHVLSGIIREPAVPPTSAPASPGSSVLDRIESLSDDEVDRLFGDRTTTTS